MPVEMRPEMVERLEAKLGQTEAGPRSVEGYAAVAVTAVLKAVVDCWVEEKR